MHRHFFVVCAAVVVQACGSSDDSSTPEDSGIDSAIADSGTDVTKDDTHEASTDAGSDGDADDGACPIDWTVAPSVDPSLLPDGGDAGSVLLHASGIGTQDYTCTATTSDAGTTYAWLFVGPEADLDDCHTVKVGSHFASDAGAAAPEWMTLDGTYVVGKKIHPFTPDAGPDGDATPAVPWLLLQATSHGGAGTLSKADWIHRLNTTGGVAPSTTCDASNVGTTVKVPYTADYYFYGAP